MTITTLPDIEAYPKTILLRDETKVLLRPLDQYDDVALLEFFRRLSEDERYYLKEDVSDPEVIRSWTRNLDFSRVVPMVAVAEGVIVADATLHRSRARARAHIGELRVAVDPAYREVGLGRRLIRELLDIAGTMGMTTVTFELVSKHEEPAIGAARSVGFQEVAVLKNRIQDIWGEYQDLVLLEMPLASLRTEYNF